MLWTDMTFGVEIECFIPCTYQQLQVALADRGINTIQDAGHTTRQVWKLVQDGSLRAGLLHRGSSMIGVEVVSPVLMGEAGIEQIVKVCAALTHVGARVNSTCGLHVHIGAVNASTASLRNLCKMFLKYEAQFDSVLPASRRANAYAKSNLSNFLGFADAAERLDRATCVRSLATAMNGGYETRQHYTHFRYHKLNLQSYATHGTVEFRQHSGTTDAEKITQWVKLVAGFAARAFTLRSVRLTEAGDFSQFVAKTDRAGAAFFNSRRRALNAAAGADTESVN